MKLITTEEIRQKAVQVFQKLKGLRRSLFVILSAAKNRIFSKNKKDSSVASLPQNDSGNRWDKFQKWLWKKPEDFPLASPLKIKAQNTFFMIFGGVNTAICAALIFLHGVGDEKKAREALKAANIMPSEFRGYDTKENCRPGLESYRLKFSGLKPDSTPVSGTVCMNPYTGSRRVVLDRAPAAKTAAPATFP